MKRDSSTDEVLQRENSAAERFLYGTVMNLPWSRRVKMRRGTSVNGDKREDCIRFAVNEGGTAEVFGPVCGRNLGGFCA